MSVETNVISFPKKLKLSDDCEANAYCRYCRKELRGKDYCYGGSAYLPNGERARVNYYGGYVCSRECDFRACQELENSMPGHGYSQRIDSNAERKVRENWQ